MATGTGLGTQSGMYMNFVNTVKSHLQKKTKHVALFPAGAGVLGQGGTGPGGAGSKHHKA